VYREDIPGVFAALDDLEGAFSDSLVDKALLKEALEKVEARFTGETRKHERNVRASLLWNLFHTLKREVVGRVGPRSRFQTNHTRSSPTAFEVSLTYPYRSSGDTNSSPPASYTAYYREIWYRRLSSPVSSWNNAQALIPQLGLSQFGKQPCSPLRRSSLMRGHRGIIKITVQIKMRTYSGSPEELWLDEWHSPVERTITVPNPTAIRDQLVDQTS
jgi:hypothetical protein